MFTNDILQLKQFYATPLGEAIRLLLGNRIYTLWPNVKDETILALGYPIPYIEPYRHQATLAIAMPASQGAANWPAGQANRVFLSREAELPLRENSIERILLVHALEQSEELSGLMQEIERLLVPGGKLLVLVPNRLSLWSRSARSPFGYGRPFSPMQLKALLAKHHLTITKNSSALFLPPVYSRMLWRFAPKFEALGRLLFNVLGGVLIMEAEKQIYASIPEPVYAKRRFAHTPNAQPALSPKH